MRYLALHGFCVGSGVDVKKGEFVMVPEGRVKEWLWNGHIAVVEDEPEAIVAQDETPVNREPVMARTNRRS